jgi:hypothetical protein
VIAALFVESNGTYFGLSEVMPYDVTKDAFIYAGTYPVVAHPPCSVWCQLAPINQKRWGHKIGEDGGSVCLCFGFCSGLGRGTRAPC